MNNYDFKKYDVSNVYNDNICCSCGFCIGTCPSEAISYKIDKLGFFKPTVDKEICTKCGRCVRYCPGTQYFNYEKPEEYYMYGHSNNVELRNDSSSGGIVTEMLCFLIESKIVDYVVVVKNREKLFEPQVNVTKSIEEIVASNTSKYCPVRYGEVLKKLNDINGTVAVIGLPCQIQAIKKYFQEKKVGNVTIKYYFSLFCNHLPSFNATEYLLENFNISHQDVEKILYRGKGWPGKFQIITKKRDYYLPFRETFSTGFGKYFKNRRCLLCNDPFGQMADASFGDAYFLNEKENYMGNTSCIVRNKEVSAILRTMANEGLLTLAKGPEKETILSTFKGLYIREEDHSFYSH